MSEVEQKATEAEVKTDVKPEATQQEPVPVEESKGDV